MIFEQRVWVMESEGLTPARRLEIIERVFESPRGDSRFIALAHVTMNINTPAGMKQVNGQKMIDVAGDTVEDAFDVLPELLEVASKEIAADIMREINRKQLVTPSGFNGR